MKLGDIRIGSISKDGSFSVFITNLVKVGPTFNHFYRTPIFFVYTRDMDFPSHCGWISSIGKIKFL